MPAITAMTDGSETVLTDCPVAHEIDILAENYSAAKAQKKVRDEEFKSMEDELVEMVTRFGMVPPHAEASRRLQGRTTILTVTRGNTVAVNEDRVTELRDALAANQRGDLFHRIFAVRTKHELQKDADTVLRSESMSKRLGERVLSLFGRCFTVKRKAPSLKVESLKPKTDAKKKAAR